MGIVPIPLPIIFVSQDLRGKFLLTPRDPVEAPLALELEKQLAEAAKTRRAATLKQNQVTDRIIVSEREKGRARDLAAEMVGANPHYITDAETIKRDAPEILNRHWAAMHRHLRAIAALVGPTSGSNLTSRKPASSAQPSKSACVKLKPPSDSISILTDIKRPIVL